MSRKRQPTDQGNTLHLSCNRLYSSPTICGSSSSRDSARGSQPNCRRARLARARMLYPQIVASKPANSNAKSYPGSDHRGGMGATQFPERFGRWNAPRLPSNARLLQLDNTPRGPRSRRLCAARQLRTGGKIGWSRSRCERWTRSPDRAL